MDSLTNLSAPNPSNTTMVYAPSSEFSRADEILVRNNVQQKRKYLSFHEEYLLFSYMRYSDDFSNIRKEMKGSIEDSLFNQLLPSQIYRAIQYLRCLNHLKNQRIQGGGTISLSKPSRIDNDIQILSYAYMRCIWDKIIIFSDYTLLSWQSYENALRFDPAYNKKHTLTPGKTREIGAEWVNTWNQSIQDILQNQVLLRPQYKIQHIEHQSL